MIISHKYKFIFIAIPKSASQYIRKIFRPYLGSKDQEICALFDKLKSDQYPKLNGVGHISAERIKKEVGEKIWKTYFKFAFIRDPYERIISIFSFRKKRYFKSLEENGNTKLLNEIYNSKPFTKMFYHGRIQNFFRRTQSHWIYDENDNLMIDFVGSMNNLHNDLKYIFKKVGLPEYNEKEVINKSREIKDYRQYYDKSLNSIVNNDFKRDLSNLSNKNFYTENTKLYLKNQINNYWIKRKHILHNNNKHITINNTNDINKEINNIKEQMKYLKPEKKRYDLTNTSLQINLISKNLSENFIEDEQILTSSIYTKAIAKINNIIKNKIPFKYSILQLKYIELLNKYNLSYIFRNRYYYEDYHYTLIIPLNNLQVKRNNRRLTPNEDDNNYPILLNNGSIFFINSLKKIYFEYPNNTKLLYIKLLNLN